MTLYSKMILIGIMRKQGRRMRDDHIKEALKMCKSDLFRFFFFFNCLIEVLAMQNLALTYLTKYKTKKYIYI